MKKIRFPFALIALVMAIAGSAYTKAKTLDADLVWFKVDPATGQALDPTDGHQGDTPPSFMDCQGNDQLCARALSISENEVDPNGTAGSYSIANNVDITSSYNDQRLEEQ